MFQTVSEALDADGSPPDGFRAWPINFGVAWFGPQQPVVVENGVISIKPREIFHYDDWRVYFVPEDI